MQRERDPQHPMGNPLQDSDALLRVMIENLPGGAAFVVDRDLRYLLAEGEALATAGFKPEDFMGRTIFEVLSPNLAASYEPMYRQALAGEPFEHEHTSHSRTYISRGTPLRTENGAIDAVLVVSYDITERNQAETALRESEALLAGQSEAFKAAVNGAALDESLEPLIRATVAHFEDARCAFYVVKPNRAELCLVAGMSENYAVCVDGFKIGADSLACGLAAYLGEPVITPDVTLEPRWQPWLWLAQQYDYRAVWSFPVRTSAGEGVGTFALYFQNPREATVSDRIFASTLAQAAAIIISRHQEAEERTRAEAALREREEHFRLMADAIPQIVWITDADGRVEFFNKQWSNYTGVSYEPTTTPEVAVNYVHPDDAEMTMQAFNEARQTGGIFEVEHRIRSATGTYRWFLVRAEPYHDPQTGSIIRWFGSSTDIHDRKRIEVEQKQAKAAIAADLRDTQLLHNLATRLTTEGDIQTLYQEIMAAAIVLTRADAGTVQILDETTQDLLLLATQGFERNMTDHFYRVNARSNTPCGIALATGDRTFVDFDVPKSEDPDGSMRIHVEAGCLSAQSTPLIARSGKAIGMVSTHWREHHRPTERELRFLDLLARQAADLIEQRQVASALQESEEKFRAFVNAASDIIYEMSADWREMRFLEGKAFIATTEEPRHDWLEEYIPETDKPRVRAAIDHAIANCSNFELEHRVIRLDGTVGWTFSRAIPVISEAGELVKWFGAASDITERKRREANLAFLANLMNDFAPLATAEDIMVMAGKRIAEHLNLSRYLFVEINPEAGECTYLLPSRPPGHLEISGSFILANYHTEAENRLLWAGHSMVVNDVRDGTRSPEQIAAFEAFDIASIVNTPYLSNGRWVFDLGVTRNQPSVWREDEIELLREISARLWLRIERARAEADLRESEAKYRSLFNSIDEGFCLFEMIYDETGAMDYRFLEVNPVFEQQTGLKNVVGKLGSEVAPNTESHWFETYDNVLKTGNPQRIENYNQATDRWYSAYASRVGGVGSRQVCTIFSDITERKRRELNTAFLDEIGKELSVLSAPDEIIQTVGVRLSEFLQASSCIFADVDEAKNEATIHHGWNTTDVVSLKQTFRLADYFGEEFARAGRAGETVIVRDTAQDERANAEAYVRLKIGSFVTVPFQRNGRWTANITVTTREPRDWREDEIGLLQEIINRVFPRIERARAEEALRESEAKYRALFTSMDEGYFLCDVIFDENDQPIDLFYIDENPAAIRMTGQSFRGQRLREINPNYEDYWYEIFGRVAQTGQGERLERYAEPDQIWYDFYVFKVGRDDQGRVAVVFNDITDRKRAEEQLRHAAEMGAFRLKLSDALRSLSDAVEIHTVVTRIALNFFDADRCYYCEIVDGSAIIRQDASQVGLPSVAGVYPLSDFPIFKAVIDAGRPLVVEDAHTTNVLDEALRQLCCEMQVISFINVPVIKEGEPIGAFCITQTTPRNWTALETELAQETAERLWAAVERARVEASLRESEIQRVREQSVLEQERQRAESLAELDRAKTLFFSNVSHEFRTPLTLMLAPLQDALSDRPLPAIQRERLELVQRNSLRLLKLVNTLLDFSRIEAGRMEAVYEPTDLATFTADLASVFRSAIERAGLQLIVDCPPLPEPVYVDREMWEKIVLNLLSNAFKFTFGGAITVRLRPADGSQAILQIQDTGTGIAPEHLPHLFKRFYQVRGTQARIHEGSGIGLALVHELVRLQGGTIEVSSTLGEGTCFTIALPFGTDHLPSVRVASPQENRLQDEGDHIQPTRTLASTAIGATSYVEEAERWLLTGDPPQPPLEKGENAIKVPLIKGDVGGSSELEADPISSARVLLVDDNADMREYLTRILSKHVQVEAVADGTTALAVAQERVPDLILSDVMMPGLDGFELLDALRSDPRTREVPIILLSARAGEEAIVEGLEAGADDYLIKPFSAQELVSRVTAHLQTAQLRGAALQQERTMNRQKDDFISVVSHELNTPLVSILGWTRLLRSNPSNPAMLNKALDTIERNATLQGKLVQDLLDLSRITAGKFRLNPQPIELKPVMETAIATVTQTAANKGIHLTWQENATKPVVVMGDGDRLSQVFINLLTNAIKFTPEGGRVEVSLSLVIGHWSLVEDNGQRTNDKGQMTNDHYAEIRVTDTGIGIAADFLPYVFDRFRQAEGTHSAKGLGLGLAIACHIVELHHGTIHAQSAGEGQGATFTVRLPLLRNDGSEEGSDRFD